ncbi:MAG: hypothetical protein EZS28_031988 [Streblomastix strix]|uniref:Uncharacterized protein n=1 Tax=Streblomastix strix TaxID=222440 RepID=A0A5J4URQ0_9EUKA|nr:MAG: hypothetical protein EZS28_031988 [Streblomastix strix]
MIKFSEVSAANHTWNVSIETPFVEYKKQKREIMYEQQGLSETCNSRYGAAIVVDCKATVQISESTFRTFEGPTERTLNGAKVSIDKSTVLDNIELRNRETLSSMQTKVVCEGRICTTTVDVALDNAYEFLVPI